MRPTLWLGMLGCALACACEGPDCRAICEHSLSCDVTFTPADDPNLRRVESGERSAQASCELGCQESLAVDQATQACILEVPATDPARCRERILQCLGRADGGD